MKRNEFISSGSSKAPPAAAAMMLVVWLAACCPAASPAAAATGFDLDPSIRSAGTGGASGAVFWGGDPDIWANPALCGYASGLRYDSGRTQWKEPGSSDATYETRRFRAGKYGMGILLAGKPERFGSSHLDYGESQGLDTGGNTVSFHPYRRVSSWGGGVSLVELASAIAMSAGKLPPPWWRKFDVAAGMTRNEEQVELAPGMPDEVRSTDFGVLGRFTPFDTFQGARGPSAPKKLRWPKAHDPIAHDPKERPFPNLLRRPPGPHRLDLAYGFSIRNAADSASGGAIPGARIYRHALSARLISQTRDPNPRLFGPPRSKPQLYSFGVSGDLQLVRPRDGSRPSDVRQCGAELAFADLLSLRLGYIADGSRGARGLTTGLGLGYRFGGYAGVRWDWARVPQAGTSQRVARRGLTVWLDPFALRSALRGN